MFVCPSVSEHEPGRTADSTDLKFDTLNRVCNCSTWVLFGLSISKVKVKVIDNVKSTYLAITFEPMVVETSSLYLMKALVIALLMNTLRMLSDTSNFPPFGSEWPPKQMLPDFHLDFFKGRY